MRSALALLSSLRQILPPDRGSHALLVGKDGRLVASVRHHGIAQSFFFDDDDFQRPAESIAAEIVDMIGRDFAPQKRAS